MSFNLFLRASVMADLRLRGGCQPKEIREEFPLWQTPTTVTDNALKTETNSPLLTYLEWAREVEPNDTVIYGFTYDKNFGTEYYEKEEYEANTDESSVPWDDLPKTEEPTCRAEHEKELREWLMDHDGWKIEWYGM